MINWLRQFLDWLSRIAMWLRRALPVLIAVFIIPFIFLIFCSIFATWEPRIRLTGMMLEILGLTTVAIGIKETRGLFGRPSLLRVGRAWLTRFPGFRQKTNIISGTANITLQGASASIYGAIAPSPMATRDERITFLEKNVTGLRNDLEQTRAKLDHEAKQLRNEINVSRQQLEDEVNKTRKLIEDAAAGGLHLEAIGVFWLLVGIPLATASNEIATLIGVS